MSPKTLRILGWVLSILLGFMFLTSAFLKLTQHELALGQAASIGLDPATYRLIGVIEILALILFFLPKTGLLGGLLLIAYMGGAIATHLQHQQPVTMAVAMESFLWIALALRFPELLQRLFPSVNGYILRG